MGHYAVALDLDAAAGTVTGTERIELTVHESTSPLVFDSGALVVDSVRTAGGALPFVQYLKDVNGWRRRVEKLRGDGHDRPLVFPDWSRPTADDRAVVYQKGPLALHTLREQLGDDAFWAAVRACTKAQAGQAVTSADLQRAFEASSGRNLGAFFAEWVQPR